MKTTVVNVKVAHIRPEYDNLKEWMKGKDHVYIARRGIVFIDDKRFPPKESIFHNPFKITGTVDRDESMRLFGKYFRDKIKSDPDFKKEVLKLKGKTLGCWCKPLKCHGDIIARYVNGNE